MPRRVLLVVRESAVLERRAGAGGPARLPAHAARVVGAVIGVPGV